ncbi:hypothetical protein [Natrinema caseinilyticum]|uniref:hypothetical protein n=1 Tax=Natrinema caseinilyticum TaxID=2961570 RepID=UPI0020C29485|nr:hypothetical protein [Natrinema caseinilyticum]
MVSRETAAHVGAVGLAIAVWVVAASFDVGGGAGPASIAVTVVHFGLIFGGGHLYLALPGDDGAVPADARWRYVRMLAVVLGGGALVTYAGDRTIGTVPLATIGIPIVVLIVGRYLLTETIAAYRASRPE